MTFVKVSSNSYLSSLNGPSTFHLLPNWPSMTRLHFSARTRVNTYSLDALKGHFTWRIACSYARIVSYHELVPKWKYHESEHGSWTNLSMSYEKLTLIKWNFPYLKPSYSLIRVSWIILINHGNNLVKGDKKKKKTNSGKGKKCLFSNMKRNNTKAGWKWKFIRIN